jgi:streptomycin 6-kinase
MQLNPKFISNVHDIYGEVGKIWLKDLPHFIKRLSSLWDFQFINPMENLSCNFVGLVSINATAKTAILKVAPEGSGHITPEIKWLKCIKEGVPAIYRADETFNAYLMEHLEPGHSLKSLIKSGKDDEATRIICQTIRSIQSQQCSKVHFRHLRELAKALILLEGKFDDRLLSKAQNLFHDLTINQDHDVILHGDLHHDNILASGPSWKAIDPHGYVGDPAAEGGAMVRNAFECFPHNDPVSVIVERRLQIMAEELPFDPQKIKAWAFCMTVLSGAWSVEDCGVVPDYILTTANAIDQAKI